MATKEVDGLLQVKDAAGDVNVIYPVTRAENVEGLSDGYVALDETGKIPISQLPDMSYSIIDSENNVASFNNVAGMYLSIEGPVWGAICIKFPPVEAETFFSMEVEFSSQSNSGKLHMSGRLDNYGDPYINNFSCSGEISDQDGRNISIFTGIYASIENKCIYIGYNPDEGYSEWGGRLLTTVSKLNVYSMADPFDYHSFAECLDVLLITDDDAYLEYIPYEESILNSAIVVQQSRMLETARLIRTNLSSTTAASFDGSADITPGVTGTLPITNGGTGATTAAAARTKLGAAAKPTVVTVTLTASGWTGTSAPYTQTVTVSGVSADETQQSIQPIPKLSSQAAYMEAGIYASGQAANSLTFSCSKKPTVDLTVYVVIQGVL